MNEQNKNGSVAVAAVALGLAVAAVVLCLSVLLKPVASPLVAPAPQVVVVPGAPSGPVPSQQPEEQLGGLVHNQTENFDAGLAVKGITVIGADRSVTSTDMYASGTVRGNIMSRATASMSAAATTTACSFLNSSGLSRTVIDSGVRDRGTAASLGSVTWVSGTSSSPGVATVATGKGLNTYVVRLSGVDRITTTSTSNLTAYNEWGNGEYYNFVSGTTTNAGTCSLLYF